MIVNGRTQETVEIETSRRCGGKLKVIASIEDRALIERIVAHLKQSAPEGEKPRSPLASRAPPPQPPLL